MEKILVKNHVVSYTHIYVIIFIFNILISEHQRKKKQLITLPSLFLLSKDRPTPLIYIQWKLNTL